MYMCFNELPLIWLNKLSFFFQYPVDRIELNYEKSPTAHVIARTNYLIPKVISFLNHRFIITLCLLAKENKIKEERLKWNFPLFDCKEENKKKVKWEERVAWNPPFDFLLIVGEKIKRKVNFLHFIPKLSLFFSHSSINFCQSISWHFLFYFI